MLDGIQRWTDWAEGIGKDRDGDWVRYDDMADAWAAKMAAIREALEAERAAADTERSEYGADRAADVPWSRSMQDASDIYDQARAALDALLVAP